MPAPLNKPRYDREEFARRGKELYEGKIRAQVEPGNEGKIVALDVDSGEFEIAATSLDATTRLLERVPSAQVWCVRIGQGPVHRFGPRLKLGPL